LTTPLGSVIVTRIGGDVAIHGILATTATVSSGSSSWDFPLYGHHHKSRRGRSPRPIHPRPGTRHAWPSGNRRDRSRWADETQGQARDVNPDLVTVVCIWLTKSPVEKRRGFSLCVSWHSGLP
jgi:hypothetical protein